MKTIMLNIPDSVDLNDREAKMLLASRLYEKGKLTLGQASELVGLSKETFMELLADYDVPFINHSTSDLDNDIKNARRYNI
jgi:predicted HTH domain antitoxin